MGYNFLLKNGTIVDGKGSKAFKGSVAVKDGKIAVVTKNGADTAALENCSESTVDAGGLTICPGFIDMHSHADWVLPLPEHPAVLAPLLEQGITTVIGGNCGYSPAPLVKDSVHLDYISAQSEFLSERPIRLDWRSMDSFLNRLDEQGLALNLVMLAGHGNLRLSMLGPDFSHPGDRALETMEQEASRALEEGACGISLGLGYAPGIFSEMRELEKFAACARRHGRILTVHLKAYTRLSGAYPLKLFNSQPHNLRALREMLDLARKTGVKMQISHLLFVGKKTWPMCETLLDMIDSAADEGLDIAFDSFPYTCGNTTVYIVFPTWFLDNIEQNLRSPAARLRLKFEIGVITRQLGFNLDDIQLLWGGHPETDRYNGLFFDEVARQMGVSLFDAYLRVCELSRGKALCLMHKYNGDEEEQSLLQKIVAHPLNLVETDTILTTRGLRNPSSFGTFPRLIGHYHKKLGLLSLEEAVAKSTGKTAERFGIRDRGSVSEGNWADLTIFNYDEIGDNTTVKDLEKQPTGIKQVFINGQKVVENGRAVAGRPAGMVLRA